MLEVSNLEARHGLLSAVRGVSLTVSKGEVVGLIGANGAGKTTLFRAISGVHTSMSGTVKLNGKPLDRLSPSRRVAAGLAMVPEGRRLFADMSVRENLQIAGENGRKGQWVMDRVLEALPQMKPILHVAAGNLSGGQRQAVAIGRALMTNPEVLLLDEVSLGLSPIAVDGLYQSLEGLKQQGETAIIVVEQDLARAVSFADRVMCMLEGQIVLAGRSADLTHDDITRAYFGIEAGASGARGGH